ncbi:peptidoglycan bridge formation glycyltransferase FemA/FemB family protein [Patescibacteria group bacterium]|nr:peptidoglycan bridge formation glycyltransferase FemA/FemB family protein [Patescibacteria group bacterium]MBU0964516.1 peptidoglycan bridge formation glycyltransferase FemA/FemB family protein [Patescibacteria group bacterium]
MEIKEIIHKEVLNEFIGSQKMSQFLQSWEWGEFQKSLDRQIWRLGVFEGDNLVGSALVIKQTLPMGKCYLYCPRGPVGDNQDVFKELEFKIASLGKEQSALFVKIEPPIEKKNRQFFKDVISGFNSKPADFVQPQDSWYMDLSQSEDELLQAMHHKTRYNIRLAEKKGVTVRISGAEDLDKFWQLNLATSRRDQFSAHSKNYYQKMLETLSGSGFMKMFIAEYKGQSIAANLVTFFGDTVTYVHGASADEQRNVMAPQLLQWRQIQEAKRQGFRHYDFWGVAPEGAAKEQAWSGITRFKQGFGGQGMSYVGTYDLIINPGWYKLYKLAKTINL